MRDIPFNWIRDGPEASLAFVGTSVEDVRNNQHQYGTGLPSSAPGTGFRNCSQGSTIQRKPVDITLIAKPVLVRLAWLQSSVRRLRIRSHRPINVVDRHAPQQRLMRIELFAVAWHA